MKYKIPLSRLVRLFKKGRDNWKKRSNEKQKHIRYLEIKVRDLEKSREEWKKKSAEYKAELDGNKKELDSLKKKEETQPSLPKRDTKPNRRSKKELDRLKENTQPSMPKGNTKPNKENKKELDRLKENTQPSMPKGNTKPNKENKKELDRLTQPGILSRRIRKSIKNRIGLKVRRFIAGHVFKAALPYLTDSPSLADSSSLTDSPCLTDPVRDYAFGHSFPLYIIELSIRSYIENGISLRGVSKTLNLFSEFFGNETPSHSSVRKWVFRAGLFLLRQPVKKSSNKIWILDHSIESGSEKLFAAVGTSLEQLKKQGFSPKHNDITLLELEPVTKSNGEIVFEKLREMGERLGVPQQIVIDGGGDLKKGVEFFREDHPETVHIYDISHKLAVLLKHELQHDEGWKEFFESVSMTGKILRQRMAAPTSYFLLLPRLYG